jgi:hypothetical protein
MKQSLSQKKLWTKPVVEQASVEPEEDVLAYCRNSSVTSGARSTSSCRTFRCYG